MDRETRPDIQAQALCRELRQEGYLVPYPVLVKAIQAAALRPEAQDGVASAALLLEHEASLNYQRMVDNAAEHGATCLPWDSLSKEQKADQIGLCALRALSQGGK